MVRYLAGVASALLLIAAGVFLYRSNASAERLPTPQAGATTTQVEPADESTPDLPEASPKSREERRFGRYDKDRDGKIAREEYLLSRRKAYAKLDVDGDGRLTFEEWGKKTTDKFAGADRDRSGALTPEEFARTALKRRARARCACPQPADD